MSLECSETGTSVDILAIGTSLGRDEYVIELTGELDLLGVTRVSEAFARALEADVRSIILDLRNLEFLDSTGVHAILKAERQASKHTKEFVIVRGPRQVQRIFEITGIADRLAFSDG
jgi:anti-sigma B factor antagonist